MKKLFFTVAFLIAMGANASASIVNCSHFVEVKQNKEYKKVDTTAVPASILKDISTKYSGYVVINAYASEDSEFKLVLSKDKKATTVYYSGTGEFIKEHA